MLAADTNVWARALLRDDPDQARTARTALKAAKSMGGGIFVPLIVLAELAWVLRTRWSRADILNAFEQMIHSQGVMVEARGSVQTALSLCRRSQRRGGFTDHLTAQVSYRNGAHSVITFDRRFARSPDVLLLA